MDLDEKNKRNIHENSDSSEPIQNCECHCDCGIDICNNEKSIDRGHDLFKVSNIFLMIFLIFTIFYFGYSIFRSIDIKIINIGLSGIESFSTAFISLIMQAVTFMLASPIVNPITIAATVYAFPERPEIVFYRLYLGITIALAVGITWMLLPEKNSVLLKNKFEAHCSCVHCDDVSKVDGRILNRIKFVLLHASEEFFNVGRFLIVGAIISSLVQVTFPKEWLTGLAGSPIATVVAMMLAAFFMSVCSTADAFIARSFATTVPMQGVMSFMVLGPLLDVKNVLMMTGCFTKRFVIKITLIIMGLGFSILLFLTNLIYG